MEMQISRRNLLKLGGAGTLAAISGARNLWGAEMSGVPHHSGGLAEAFKGGRYVLPNLPYTYNALEPLYEERTLKIHHTKHHAGYVRALNEALDKFKAARQSGDYGSAKALSCDLAYNGSGHVLHVLFWHSMKTGGSAVPENLASAMKSSFGSVATAKEQFAATTKAVEGAGWGILAYEPIAKQLLILQAEKHQNLAFWGVAPILVCDVWEHAYYLQYENNRGEWVDNFMKLANWGFAAERLAEAVRGTTA